MTDAPAPHPIDIAALRKLREAAPDEGIQIIPSSNKTSWERCISARDFFVATRNALPAILDELDRLRAAEAASKARVEELERGAEAYPDECHETHDVRSSDASTYDVVCKNCGLHDETANGWGQLRKPCPARAEIARLTGAGATFADAVAVVEKLRDWWRAEYSNNGLLTDLAKHGVDMADAILRDLEALASEKRSPPPAAADRGVPGQRDEDGLTFDERLKEEERYLTDAVRNADDEDGPGIMPGDVEGAFSRIRVALATAPKAEDVRREAIKEAACEIEAEALKIDMPGYGRHFAAAVRALADRPAR